MVPEAGHGRHDFQPAIAPLTEPTRYPKTKLEFPKFDMVNTCKPMNIGLISISPGESHYPFAPTLPQ